MNIINSPLKIISKILASDQLAKVIDKLVDKSQSVFIKSRYIMDNVVTAKALIFVFKYEALWGI